MAEYLLSVWHDYNAPQPAEADVAQMYADVDALNAKLEPLLMSTTSNTQATAAAGAVGKSCRRLRLPYMGFTAWIGCLILLGWLLAQLVWVLFR